MWGMNLFLKKTMSEKSLITKETSYLSENFVIYTVWPVHIFDKLALGVFVNLCTSTSHYYVVALVN